MNSTKPTDSNSPQTPEEAAAAKERRNFLIEAIAGVLGAILVVIPLGAGIYAFFDPLMRRGIKKQNPGSLPEGPEKPRGESFTPFLPVAHLSDVNPDGTPLRATVIDDLVDVWTFSPREPIGSVFLVREGDTVKAFNTTCPHAGCAVELGSDGEGEMLFKCPCHNSAFHLDGSMVQPSPSPRTMDELKSEIRDGDVWVQFENFYPGKAEKIAKT